MPLLAWPPAGPEPAPPLPRRAPSLALAIVLQTLALREPVRALLRRRERPGDASGGGAPVLVLPGMGMGDLSTLPLRRHLRRRGFDARGWGLGRHRPDAPRTLGRLLPRLEGFAAASRRPVALVGWSLGGVVARELARLRPDLVRCVITLGAPVVGGLRHTAIAGLFRVQGWDLDEVERRIAAAAATPIRVPVTAIWSRRDGIVAWQACIDTTTPGAENLEATSAHWGLGLDPDVLDTIASRLSD
jgi:pimeloyl-ACP methyl ester carboxylesterase